MSKDFLRKNVDLSNLIPQYLRNKLNVSLMKNLFNKMLTKDESLPLYGWVGKQIQGDTEEKPYIQQPNVDREINSLIPLIYGKVGIEEYVFSFNDILNKARTIGIDVDNFDEWGAARSFNFCPPIDIDKFTNFSQYFWVGKKLNPSNVWNPNNDPEYYVIKTTTPLTFGVGNDWQKSNYWVNKADLQLLGYVESQVVQARRPIIEYRDDIEVNVDILTIGKYSFNQLPLFNLYESDGTPTDFISSIFFYQEGQEYNIDSSIKRRIKRDNNADYVFGHGLVKDRKLYYYKQNGNFDTIWIPGPNAPIATKTNPIVCDGIGDGQLTIDSIAIDAPNETWTITCLTPTVFSVRGSKSGDLGVAIVGTPFNGIVSFTISNGITSFVGNDLFTFRILNKDIPRYVYIQDGSILNFPGGAAADTSEQKQGAWITPSTLLYNPFNETKDEIRHGDLIDHFRSIIGAQVDFSGSVSGVNNFRNLPNVDFGLGGKIKMFDNYFNLFLSNMLQRDISPISILDFAESQYLQSLNSLNDYVNQNLLNYLTENGNVNLSSVFDIGPGSDIIDVYYDYEDIYEDRSDLKPIFYDSTNVIPNWAPTLPQLGLTPGVLPTVEFEMDLGLDVFIHHDGHKSPLNLPNPTFDKQLALAEVERYTGVKTQGFVKTSIPPLNTSSLFKNQLWFNPNNNELRIFNVIGETASAPITANVDDFWYDRGNNLLKKWDGLSWTVHTSLIDAWSIVDTTLIRNTLTLYAENRLYLGIPPSAQKWTNTIHQSMEIELAKFSLKYGYDPLGSDYVSNDAFTWNYKGASTQARWHEVYKEYFDSDPMSVSTQRPNLEPWKLLGYTAKPITWDAMYASTTDSMVNTTLTKSNVKAAYIKNNTLFLPVLPSFDPSNGPLIVDGETLSVGDRILVSDPGLNSKRNGIYTVTSVLITHSILQRSSDALTLPVGTNVTVNSGDLWANSKWVVTNTGAIDVDPIIISQFNRLWKMDMWNDIKISNPIVKLCVNVYNDDLLPPYVSPTVPWSNEALFTVIPPNPTQTYLFGENGPVETVWKKSLEYRYGELRSDFKYDPINFLTKTWGLDYNQNLNIENDLGFKLSHTDFHFHGDIKDNTVDPTQYYSFLGLAQYYTQLLRYNSVGTKNTYNSIFYNSWDIKLGYRANGLIESSNLIINTDRRVIPQTSYDVMLKKNPYTIDTWLESIRIQLVKVGNAELNEFGEMVPINKAEDWEFRIETYNNKRPVLEYYILDTNGPYTTFNALDSSKCSEDWNIYSNKTSLTTSIVPQNIIGLQNVVNVLYGYFAKLKEDGWDFSGLDTPHVDSVTGRTLDWQLEVEKFIHYIYSGMVPGAGYILNPFMTMVWFKTPRGMVSEFNTTKFFDPTLVPAVYDVIGNVIPNKSLTIIRQDEFTSISSDTPMSFIHSYLDEYEHVILFDDYVDNRLKTGLIFDPFLGARVNRIFLTGKKQITTTGRPNFGGYFVNGNSMVKNIESHVDEISQYYSVSSIGVDDHYQHALALLGYAKKDYFSLLDISDNSQFQFWRGLIQYKGTNSSLNAFLNSSKFKDASIDEYWLYKLAEYGDARIKRYPEMKVSQYDCLLTYSKFIFESESPSDNDPLNPSYPKGFTFIESLDENRWVSIEDLSNYYYFLAEEKNKEVISTTTNPQIVNLSTVGEEIYEYGNIIYSLSLPTNGIISVHPVKIGNITTLPQVWEFVRDAVDETLFNVSVDSVPLMTCNVDTITSHPDYPYFIWEIQKQSGFDVGDTITVSFSAERINSYTLRFNEVGSHTISIVNPLRPKFDPAKLIDYRHNVFLEDIPVWHPAIGYHNTTTLDNVDVSSSLDPAKYSEAVQIVGNINYDPLRPWGKKEVGKIWWDSEGLEYIPYFDYNIFPDIEERLSRWGSIADYSNVKVYEWVESTVPPSEYDALAATEGGNTEIDASIRASGKAARKTLYKRDRIIYGRPIAWGYRSNPAASSFIGFSFDEGVYVGTTTIGLTSLILDAGKFEDFGIESGMKFSGWDFNVDQPIGEAVFQNEIDYIVGAEYSASSPIFGTTTILNSTGFLIEVTSTDPYIGGILFTNELIGSEYYVKATSVGTGVSDSFRIKNIDWTLLDTDDSTYIDFPNIGIRMRVVIQSPVGASLSAIEEQTIAEEIGNPAHDVFIRQAMTIDIQIPLPDVMMSNDPDDLVQYGWRTWNDPTQEDLDSDLLEPNNSWVPFFGDYQLIPTSSSTVTLITDFDNLALTLKDGTVVQKYQYSWTDWEVISDSTFNFISTDTITPIVITFDQKIVMSRLSVYVNGITKTNVFTIDGKTLTISPQKIGDKIKVIYRKEVPSDDVLSFDPEVSDNPTIQTQYKNDYSYTIIPVRDSSGNILSNKYYYWVENKTTVAYGKKSSIQQIVNNIKNGPDLFMNFQYHLQEQLLQNGTILPLRYNATVLYGMNRYVTQDNTYKLRLVQNLTLQDDPHGLDLKNVHAEWTLIRPSQNAKIPTQLWLKLTDAVCGEDSAGNVLPSVRRSEFDARHGTRTQYGFAGDQILVDSTFAKDTVTYTILNTQLTKEISPDVFAPDYITALDFTNSDNWFIDPETSRETMELIWNTATPEQINEIFFAVLQDALANNYEFTDIIKTSYISAYSERLIQPPVVSVDDDF